MKSIKRMNSGPASTLILHTHEEMIQMKLFRKERQSLRVKKIRAARAVFLDQDVQEMEIEFETEEGDRLTLQFMPRLAPGLIQELTGAYEAINPPLSRQRNPAADWSI